MLAISIDYCGQQWQYKRRLARRFLIYCLLFGYVSLVALCMQSSIVINTLLIICSLGYNLVMLRFHQFSTLVDVIYRRYRSINEHIDHIYLRDLNRMTMKMNLVNVLPFIRATHCDRIQTDPPQIDKFQLIWRFREVAGLLHEASRNLNGRFTVSYTMCILNEFIASILTNYFCLEASVQSGNHCFVVVLAFL